MAISTFVYFSTILDKPIQDRRRRGDRVVAIPACGKWFHVGVRGLDSGGGINESMGIVFHCWLAFVAGRCANGDAARLGRPTDQPLIQTAIIARVR